MDEEQFAIKFGIPAALAITIVLPTAVQGSDGTVPFHTPVEILSILAGITAIVAGIATARKYGGTLGTSLKILAGGTAAVALERIVHILTGNGIISGVPSTVGIYLLAIGLILFAGGFAKAYRAV